MAMPIDMPKHCSINVQVFDVGLSFAVLSAQEPEARLINIRVNLTSTFKIRENECVINENECGNIYKYIYHIHK